MISACQDKKSEIVFPSQDDGELVEQMSDLYFIDSWIARSKLADRDSLKQMLVADFEIAHGIKVEDVRAKFSDLEKDPKRYGIVMDSIILILNKKKN